MCFLLLIARGGRAVHIKVAADALADSWKLPDEWGVDTSNAAGRIVAGVLASLAELEPAQWATVRRNDIDLVGIEAVRKQLMTPRLYQPV